MPQFGQFFQFSLRKRRSKLNKGTYLKIEPVCKNEKLPVTFFLLNKWLRSSLFLFKDSSQKVTWGLCKNDPGSAKDTSQLRLKGCLGVENYNFWFPGQKEQLMNSFKNRPRAAVVLWWPKSQTDVCTVHSLNSLKKPSVQCWTLTPRGRGPMTPMPTEIFCVCRFFHENTDPPIKHTT